MKIGKIKKYSLMYIVGTLNLIYYKKVSKDPPIIIAGCGRSGTTLLLSILSAHPKIHGIDIETGIYSDPYLEKKPKILTKILTAYYLKKGKKRKATRWVEKTPRNVRNIRIINHYFNNRVKIINIIRDGRDVVTSIHPTKKDSYWVSIERWINDVSMGLKYDKLENVYTIKYEDLILNFSDTIKKILLFLDEELVEEVIDYVNFTNVKSNRAWEGNVKKITNKSINKWGREKYKSRIKEFYNNDKALNLLEKLGYKI